jgi:hypothetical protein
MKELTDGLQDEKLRDVLQTVAATVAEIAVSVLG